MYFQSFSLPENVPPKSQKTFRRFKIIIFSFLDQCEYNELKIIRKSRNVVKNEHFENCFAGMSKSALFEWYQILTLFDFSQTC